MADPLSIAASIVGLIATAGKIYTVVSDTASSVSDAPRSIRSMAALINDIKATLIALQHLLDTLNSLPSRRKELIRLDHVTVCFSECVLTLSELESIVCRPQIREGGFRSRLRWTSSEKRVARILPQLESQKTCLSLMLTILQCESDLDAAIGRDQMQATVEKIIEQNTTLSARLEQLEAVFDEGTRSVKFFDAESTWDAQSVLVTDTSPNQQLDLVDSDLVDSHSKIVVEISPPNDSSPELREFESDLSMSRVYNRAVSDDCDMSFSSSTMRSNVWSILSRISLNDISIIAVYRLPVTLDDINRFGANLTFAMLISDQSSPLTPLSGDRTQIVSRIPKDQMIDVRLKGTDIKVVIVGDACTGKTSLLMSYVTGECPNGYVPPTVFEKYDVTLRVTGVNYNMDIFDTAGVGDYDRIRPLSYPDTNVFIVCYRIGHKHWRDSWENVKQKWLPEITRYGHGIPFVIVAIRNPDVAIEDEVEGTNQSIEKYPYYAMKASELGAAGYATCNMHSPQSVKDVFDKVIVTALERPAKPTKRKRFWQRNDSRTSLRTIRE
ncbi:hypothetical protein F5Y04DRAFT_261059 [Hypomontagnella monticulosa]|nr:hypothetical protein F5Y04DRAFT_261059 [Hypomontagnella monticulosa]